MQMNARTADGHGSFISITVRARVCGTTTVSFFVFINKYICIYIQCHFVKLMMFTEFLNNDKVFVRQIIEWSPGTGPDPILLLLHSVQYTYRYERTDGDDILSRNTCRVYTNTHIFLRNDRLICPPYAVVGILREYREEFRIPSHRYRDTNGQGTQVTIHVCVSTHEIHLVTFVRVRVQRTRLFCIQFNKRVFKNNNTRFAAYSIVNRHITKNWKKNTCYTSTVDLAGTWREERLRARSLKVRPGMGRTPLKFTMVQGRPLLNSKYNYFFSIILVCLHA